MFHWKKIKGIFHKALHEGWTPARLSTSVGLGIYVAFCPFFGAHTLMILLFAWLFRLNFPILFVATSVNNPWTMIPMYTVGYSFGYWMLHGFLGLHPSWTVSLAKLFGSGEICLWSFLVGGNVLGVIFGFLSFGLCYVIFKRILPVSVVGASNGGRVEGGDCRRETKG